MRYIILMAFVFSLTLEAKNFCNSSMMFYTHYEQVEFVCSNSKIYDSFIRIDSDCWSGDQWTLAGLCSQNTLKEVSYSQDSAENSLDVIACLEEDSPEIQKCYKEFIELNNEKGKGSLKNIVQGNGKVGRTCQNKKEHAISDSESHIEYFEEELDDLERFNSNGKKNQEIMELKDKITKLKNKYENALKMRCN